MGFFSLCVLQMPRVPLGFILGLTRRSHWHMVRSSLPVPDVRTMCRWLRLVKPNIKLKRTRDIWRTHREKNQIPPLDQIPSAPKLRSHRHRLQRFIYIITIFIPSPSTCNLDFIHDWWHCKTHHSSFWDLLYNVYYCSSNYVWVVDLGYGLRPNPRSNMWI